MNNEQEATTTTSIPRPEIPDLPLNVPNHVIAMIGIRDLEYVLKQVASLVPDDETDKEEIISRVPDFLAMQEADVLAWGPQVTTLLMGYTAMRDILNRRERLIMSMIANRPDLRQTVLDGLFKRAAEAATATEEKS